MKKFRVEFGFGESFQSVEEFQTMDGLDVVQAETAFDAAEYAHSNYWLGDTNPKFRVYKLDINGEFDRHNPEYFSTDDFYPDWPEEDWESESTEECAVGHLETLLEYYMIEYWGLDDVYDMCLDDPSIGSCDWFRHCVQKYKQDLCDFEEKMKLCQDFLEGKVSEDEYCRCV